MHGESLWSRLAELPLVVEACEYERLQAVLAFEFDCITGTAQSERPGAACSCRAARSTRSALPGVAAPPLSNERKEQVALERRSAPGRE
jgi:hypothetical protein